MARDSSGNYSLPSGNPVVTGTTITSTWANDTMTDLGTEMTDSLNRSGKGPMLAALNIVDGTVSAPGLRFNDESTSGIYRSGAGKIDFSVTNSQVLSVQDAKLVWTAQSNAFDIVGAATTDLLTISGSSATTTGANLLLYGSTHATLAGDFKLRNGTTDIIHYDLSATTLNLAASTLDVNAAAWTLSSAVTVTGTWTDLGTVTTVDINGGTIDGATIGGAAAGAGTFTTLTCTSAFTSVGIDDNSTGERFELNDTVAKFGTSGAAYTIARPDNDQQLYISGSNSATSGANLRLSGNTHVSAANDFGLFEGSNKVIYYDNSASTITLSPTAGTTSAVFASGTTTLGDGTNSHTVQQSIDTKSIIVSGGTAASTGANLLLYGSTHVGQANDILLRNGSNAVLFYDASGATLALSPTAGSQSAYFTSTILRLGVSGSGFSIYRNVTDRELYVSGGSSNALGANLILYSESHATSALDFYLRASTTNVISYDHSATTLTLAPATVNVTNALNVTGAFTSIGINDDCTGQRLGVADTALICGTAGSGYDIRAGSTDNDLTITGSSSSGAGAQLTLFGNAHATTALDFALRAGSSSDVIYYDYSASQLKLYPVAGTRSVMHSANTTTLGAVSTDYSVVMQSASQTLSISGSSTTTSGANMYLRGSSHATGPGDWAIRAGTSEVVTYDLSVNTLTLSPTAGTVSAEFQNDRLVVGAAGSGFTIRRGITNNALYLSGGTTSVLGGNIALYGEAEASNAGDIRLRDSNSDVLFYDNSANTITLSPTAGTASFVLTDNVLTYGKAATTFTLAHTANDQNILIGGGTVGPNGANLLMYGGTHATVANDFRLRVGTTNVIIYDDSASSITLSPTAGTASHVFTDNVLTMGRSGSNSAVYGSDDTQAAILGGSSDANAARFLLYGATHASVASDFGLQSNGGNVIYYDSSADKLGMYAVFGYAPGAGGSATQITSRTTGVTIDAPSGRITLVSAAGSTSWQTMRVTCNQMTSTDTVIVNQTSGTDLYMIHVTKKAGGYFEITYATTGGTTTEQPIFDFAIIRAYTA